MRFLTTRRHHHSAVDFVAPTELLYSTEPDIHNDILIVDCSLTLEEMDTVIKPLLDRGMRFIYDQLWESLYHKPKSDAVLPYQENGIAFFGHEQASGFTYGWDPAKVAFVPMHFWYHSAYQERRWRAPTYPPETDRVATHDFLMPINTKKDSRDKFLELMGDRIEKGIYSKGWEKKYLPGDKEKFNDRHLNPQWYHHTWYSLVVESWQHGPTFVTEKTFKAMQYGHPFLLLAQQGALKLLKQYEFNTFPALFDESYDDEPNQLVRMKKIIEQVDQFDKSKLHLVKLAVQRNWNRFHDFQAVKELLQKEVNEPLRKFCIA